MSGTKPPKTEVARMRVMSDLGHSKRKIGRTLGRSHHTVKRYLEISDFSDPELAALIKIIKENEIGELLMIGEKARIGISNYLDDVLDGKRDPQPIPLVAIADRSFQQRRLLEGSSTENIDIHAHSGDIEAMQRSIAELMTEREALLKSEEE